MARVFLQLMMAFQILDDALFGTFFYYLRNSQTDFIPYLSTHLASISSYTCAVIALFFSLQPRKLNKHARALAITLALVLPLGAYFIVVPFLQQSYSKPTWMIVGEWVDVTMMFLVFTASLFVFISSREAFWSFFSAGLITLMLGDWSIRLEAMWYHEPSFGFYEFLWAFGIFICCSQINLLRFYSTGPVHAFSRNSLLNCCKLAATLISVAPVVLLCIGNGNAIASLRMIGGCISIVTLISALASHWLIAKLDRFSSSFILEGADLNENSVFETVAATGSVPEELRDSFERFRKEALSRRDAETRNAIADAQSMQARQVAHDIRSPLAALTITLASIRNRVSEKDFSLLDQAAERIKSIANDLLDSSVIRQSAEDSPSGLRQVEEVCSLIREIVEEKRALCHTTARSIELSCAETGVPTLFAEVNRSELSRIISNILDNALDATTQKQAAKLDIRWSVSRFGWIQISIQDNGEGIHPDVLPLIGRPGFSLGKPKGSGLGLSHARARLESWGGTLQIESTWGVGTIITMSLRQSQTPNWFIDEIHIPDRGTVVIADDDSMAHLSWERRLETLRNGRHNFRVEHLYDLPSLRNYLAKGSACPELFLIDHDFGINTESGITLIESEKLQGKAVLVTGRSSDRAVREKCEASGLKLLSKSLVPSIP
jgi:signal transduction histidine kinase